MSAQHEVKERGKKSKENDLPGLRDVLQLSGVEGEKSAMDKPIFQRSSHNERQWEAVTQSWATLCSQENELSRPAPAGAVQTPGSLFLTGLGGATHTWWIFAHGANQMAH